MRSATAVDRDQVPLPGQTGEARGASGVPEQSPSWCEHEPAEIEARCCPSVRARSPVPVRGDSTARYRRHRAVVEKLIFLPRAVPCPKTLRISSR